ncbi:1061_t:CDS:2 [Funneliformis caledonium]|uniref:1061_t:CDS:1 n=1 Tax=Funneliformis caledonium TaxID=1117310 RepID=A0A9N9GNE9_9GLOM|nr:1061_t:CDS:2 [Funneliformis caledonium]
MKRSFTEEMIKVIDDRFKKINIDVSNFGWFSCPATHTATEKGRLVKDELKFPFILKSITLRKNSRIGLFKKNTIPTSQRGEKFIQEYFIKECDAITRAFDEIHYNVLDVHKFPLLDTRKPDFVIVSKQDPLDPLNVVAVGEIRVITAKHGMFSNADIGHATSFGEKLLQLQPRRPFVYVVLTNCRVLMLIFIDRSGNSNLKYQRTPLAKLESDNGSAAVGWKQFVTLLSQDPETLGWVPSTLHHEDKEIKLVRSIGTGRTSVVYEGMYDNNKVAVKMLKDTKFIEQFRWEDYIMEKLANLNSQNLLSMELSHLDTNDDGPKFIVLSPLCKRFKTWRKEDISPIIDTLRKVHELGFIHRDFRKWNLLRDQDENIRIVDWGFSVEVNKPVLFAGSLETLPNEVLQDIIDGKKIKYTKEIELISMVRSIYLMVFRPPLERIPFGDDDIKEWAKVYKEFWEGHSQSSIWSKILDAAKQADYDGLKSLLMNLFL